MSNIAKTTHYDFAIVLDFEATCAPHKPPNPQEIIEFPSVLIELSSMERKAEFEAFVKPIAHPQLSEFCTKLTTITQRDVDGADDFPAVLKRYGAWLDQHTLNKDNALFVTCGDWDLKTMFPAQCLTSGVHGRPIFLSWLNIKKMFKEVTGERGRGMVPMLKTFDKPLVGQHHRGIDDCRNIATLLSALMEKGGAFQATTRQST